MHAAMLQDRALLATEAHYFTGDNAKEQYVTSISCQNYKLRDAPVERFGSCAPHRSGQPYQASRRSKNMVFKKRNQPSLAPLRSCL